MSSTSLPRWEPRLAAQIADMAFAWLDRLDASAIALRKARDFAKRGVDLASYALAGMFLLAFVYHILLVSGAPALFAAETWNLPSKAGFWFSWFALALAFAAYRTVLAASDGVRVPAPEADVDAPEIRDARPDEPLSNVADAYAPAARQLVENAYALALQYKHRELAALHLFIAAMESDDVAIAFGRLGLKFAGLKDALSRCLQTREVGNATGISRDAEEILLTAFLNAHAQGRKAVEPLEVFIEAYRRDAFLVELLYDKQVDERRLTNVVAWIRITGKLRERVEEFRRAALFKPTGPMNRSMTSLATPTLDALSDDLTALAANGRLPLLVGREKEVAQAFRAIEGGRQSAVLVGPEGVGKSAILAGIAGLMVEERVPAVLRDKRLVALSVPHLASGVSPEQAEARFLRILNEVSRSGNIILAVPDLDRLEPNLASILADYLDRGATFAVGTASVRGYAEAVEGGVLSRAFQRVDVREPETDEAIQILESMIGGIEYEHGIVFSYEAVERAVTLSDRYLHEEYLPKKAMEICRETAQAVAGARGKNALVTGEDVAAVVSEKANVPVTAVTTDEKERLLNLEEAMKGRVIGQDAAVSAVSAAMRRARAELRAENRPIAVFLFLGPTGVGKTELAKTLAENYFGSEEAMLRFDMSEYQESTGSSRMIGVPGSREGGLLTEAVRRNPFALVLLDELEKAHPDVLNLFLQVFEDGRLTDAAGRTVDFTNTIIIATSNAGSQYIQDAVSEGKDVDEIKTALLEEVLRDVYRPEFLNRFDGVIVFRPLSPDDVLQITYLLIDKVAGRLEPKGIAFRATDEAVKELAAQGYDPKFGARPLRRKVQEVVDDAIAKALLEGKVARRDAIVLQPGGEIRIEKAPEL